MSMINGFKRRLVGWLGGEMAEPKTPPPSPQKPPRAASTAAVVEDTDLGSAIFDPAEPANAPFFDRDSGAYPNDRRLKQRRNARAQTRVLLIDDSPTIVALLRKLLRQNGYDTLEAFDAETGIKLACEEKPDIIFLDIVLPGMNGFAALRTLRREPVTKTIPIIMISGNAAATEQFYVQRIGADDFMKKPFSRAEVFSRIELLLDAESIPRRASERNPVASESIQGQDISAP
jgi:CheY-like chemotaxis protein